MRPKKLYLGKSITDLNKLVPKIDEKNISRLAKSAEKLLKGARESESAKDEERTFILYMRYFAAYKAISVSKEYKKEKIYYDSILSVKLMEETMIKLEKVAGSLEERYALIGEAEQAEEFEKQKSLQKLLDKEEASKKKKQEDEQSTNGTLNGSSFISYQRLKALIQQQSSSFLVVDTRPSQHFVASHIKIPQTISVPQEILQKGLTAESITPHLDSEAKILWSRRGRVDQLVLLDWYTEHQPYSTPMQVLLDAITVWDPSTPYRCHAPLILNGGYDMWRLAYPMMVTNPMFEPPELSHNSSSDGGRTTADAFASLNFSYPELETAFIQTPSPSKTINKAASYPNEVLPFLTIGDMIGVNDSNPNNRRNYHRDPGTMTNGNIDAPPTSAKVPNDAPPTFAKVPNVRPLDAISHPVYPTVKPTVGSNNGPVSALPLMPTINRSLKPNLVSSGSQDSADGESPAPISSIATHFSSPKMTPNPISSQQYNDNSTINNGAVNGDIPSIPNRALKPKDLLASLATDKMKEEKSLMEESLRHEELVIAKLTELEHNNSNNNNTNSRNDGSSAANQTKLEQDMDRLRATGTRMEEKLERVSQENKKLWALVNSVLNNNTNNNNTTTTISPPPPALPTVSSPQDHNVVALAREQADHEELLQKVKVMRRERREKEERESKGAKSRGSSKRSAAPNTYHAPLRTGSPPRSRGSNLRRSHSAFNLTQLDDTLDTVTTTASDVITNNRSDVSSSNMTPVFDRTIKPLQITTKPRSLLAARHRDFGPAGRVRSRTGLKNLGNTCYMNAIVQCLTNTHPFARYFVQERHGEHLNRLSPQRGEVAVEFGAVINALVGGLYKNVAMKDLKAVVGRYYHEFRGNDQHDAHEFLINLIDWLHNDLNRITTRLPPMPEQNHREETPDYVAAQEVLADLTARDRSILTKLLYGLHRNVILCQTCHHRSLTFEPFSVLTLSFPCDGKCSLMDLFEHYYKESSIDYRCSRCNRMRKCIRKMDIWQLPPVLVIHLNRFEQRDLLMTKNPSYVDFHVDRLALSQFVVSTERPTPPNLDYALYGICNHYGTIDGGHYTAFCRDSSGPPSPWHKYDDHEVYDMQPHSVKTSAAYVLFYQSCSYDVREL